MHYYQNPANLYINFQLYLVWENPLKTFIVLHLPTQWLITHTHAQAAAFLPRGNTHTLLTVTFLLAGLASNCWQKGMPQLETAVLSVLFPFILPGFFLTHGHQRTKHSHFATCSFSTVWKRHIKNSEAKTVKPT